MAEVRLSAIAVEDLGRMIITHSLPSDTKYRVKRSLRVLEQFPNIGRQLDGRKLNAEDERERFIDGLQLACVEAPC